MSLGEIHGSATALHAAQRQAAAWTGCAASPSHCKCSGYYYWKEVHKSTAFIKYFFLDIWNIENFSLNMGCE